MDFLIPLLCSTKSLRFLSYKSWELLDSPPTHFQIIDVNKNAYFNRNIVELISVTTLP